MAPDAEFEVQKEFARTGAVILRGLLSTAEVSSLRAVIHDAFAPLDRRAGGRFVRALSAEMALRIPRVMECVVHPRVVAALKTILEPEYAIIPDFHVHRNMHDFTDTTRSITHLFGLVGPGWHHDAGSEGANPYLFDRNYRIVKCGLYLQDNTIEWGGGIETAPAGHKFRCEPASPSSTTWQLALGRISGF